LAASPLSNQQHAGGNRKKGDAKEFDRPIDRHNTEAKH
jgi:hypothetical protein